MSPRRQPAIPLAPASLVGRDAEIAEVRRLLTGADAGRLLTVTGPPGVGKTSLALTAAEVLADGFRYGVRLVDLTPIADPGLVPVTIADGLGLRRSGELPPLEQAIRFIRDRWLLLVLDNFEQVADASPVVGELLAACPNLHVLVTSRVPLRLRWEAELAVGPLVLPSAESLDDPDAVATAPAVALFVARAQAAQPGFGLTAENARLVGEICIALDGLPLAIELAAARVRQLPLSNLFSRLDRRLWLVDGPPSDRPARHQTLRAALTWSHDLLSEEERTLFRRIGVFVGGCGLDAIQRVASDELRSAGGGPDASPLASRPSPLALVAALVDHSLLRVTQGAGGESRYTMLETLRELAVELLDASGEGPDVRRLHAAYCRGLAEQAGLELHGPHQGAWLSRLDQVHDNIRAALGWVLASLNADRLPGEDEARTDSSADVGLAIAGAMGWYWYVRGHLREGLAWLEGVLESSPQGGPLRARALVSAGLLAWQLGQLDEAQNHLQEGLTIHRAAADGRGAADALTYLALVDGSRGALTDARARLGAALAGYEATGYRRGMAMVHGILGGLDLFAGDEAAAETRFAQALALYRAVGDWWGVAQPLNFFGDLARRQGRYEEAERHYQESLALNQRYGLKSTTASVLQNLGYVARHRGDGREAGRRFRDGLLTFHELGDRRGVAECLAGLALISLDVGQPTRAATLFGAAEAIFARDGTTVSSSNLDVYAAGIAAVRSRLAPDQLACAWAQGRALTPDELVREAQAWQAEDDAPAVAADMNADHGHAVRLAPSPAVLSRREREVAALFARGLTTSREIAVALVIAEGTANNYVQRVLARLQLRTRAQIAAWAAEHLADGAPRDGASQ